MNPTKIGARLKALRGDRTQREVANALGITAMAVSQYERGDRIPNDSIKIKIGNYYKVSVEEIFFTD